MNYLDRNEFNFEPSQKVVEAIKNFDPKTLCFYVRVPSATISATIPTGHLSRISMSLVQ